MAIVTALPHFHIMESDYGDPLDRSIKTWNEATRQLRKRRHDIIDSHWLTEGTATDGAYYFYENRTDSMGDPLPKEVIIDGNWDFMLSIYTCCGEQPCPYEEDSCQV